MLVKSKPFKTILTRILHGVATIDFQYPSFRHSVQVATPNGSLSTISITPSEALHYTCPFKNLLKIILSNPKRKKLNQILLYAALNGTNCFSFVTRSLDYYFNVNN